MVQDEVAKLPPAAPGKDADPVEVAELVDRAVAALEPAKDGAQGPAGESVTVEQLSPLVAETVAKAVSDELEKIAGSLPSGRDGAPGEPGKSVTVDELAPMIDEIVVRRVAEIPPAKDGADGKDGVPGRDGRDGLPGVQGEKGFDGKNGRDGVDGLDGLGFDDMEQFEDERSYGVIYRRGDESKEFRWLKATPADFYRGVWKEGPFTRGEIVTWGGSSFLALKDTAEKPERSSDWVLWVKRGRDGKDGKPGENGADGKPGAAPGRDGRSY